MSSSISHSRRRIAGRILLAFAGAAMLLLTGAPTAGAQPSVAPEDSDFTLDGHDEIAARTADGRLVIYPHSGTFDPVNPGATFGGPVTINNGWNNADWIATTNTGWEGRDVLAEVNGYISLYQHSRTWNPADPLATLQSNTTRVGGGGWDNFEWKVLGGFDDLSGLDIVGRDRTDGHLYIFPTTVNRDGSLTVGEKRLFGRDFGGYDQFAAADLNGDGASDIVARSGSKLYGFLTMAAANGPQASTNVITISDGWEQSDTTVVKDIDSDGRPDLVSRLAATGELVAFLNTSQNGTVSFTGRNELGPQWADDNPVI